MAEGKYIVIEGIAGAGKTTVVERLARELQAAGVPVQVMAGSDAPGDITAQAMQRIIDDPRYPVSTRAEVLLYNAARSQTLETVKQATAAGTICIADHSYLATLVHEYYGRGDITDYAAANQIVRYAAGRVQPDLVIVLDTPASTVKTRLSADRQSAFDEAYEERLRAGYLWEAKQRNVPVIFATEPADAVFAAVWRQVSAVVNAGGDKTKAVSGAPSVAEVLAANPPAQAGSAEPPFVAPASQAQPDGAADPAAPSSAGNPASDADAGAATGGKQHVTIEAVSELAASKLLRYGGSTRLTRTAQAFDTKDAGGRYRYYIPTDLTDEVRGQYTRSLDQLFDTYAGLVTSLAKYLQTASPSPEAAKRADAEAQARAALRPLLPVATATTVEAPVQKLERLAGRLQSDELPELNLAGRQLAKAPDDSVIVYRATTFQAVEKLADDLLPASHTAAAAEPVVLTNYIPHNELNLVADILYEHGDLPLADIQRAAAGTPYQRKTDVLAAYLGDQPGSRFMAASALTAARYTFDATCSYGAFRELQQLRPFRRATWQRLSPRLGYEVPPLIEVASATDVFEQCFDLSLRLYSALQAAGHPLEAQYATLLGHNVRWKATISARGVLALHEALAAGPPGTPIDEVRALLQLMLSKISDVHPVLTEAMHLQKRTVPAPEPAAELPAVQPNRRETA